jgi:hypothetical protein
VKQVPAQRAELAGLALSRLDEVVHEDVSGAYWPGEGLVGSGCAFGFLVEHGLWAIVYRVEGT